MQRALAIPPTVSEIARTVRRGLTAPAKSLPPWLFYDERGSELFEAITELPEYYLSRAERSIFERDGAAIMAAAFAGGDATIVELGAGTAAKTQVLLAAAADLRGTATYVPVDVSAEALAIAEARLAAEEPRVTVRPWIASHSHAFPHLRSLRGRKVVLFIGSSIGNHEGADALALLAGLRAGLGAGDALVLGTDLRKDRAVLLPAYDDAAGVTAAFNKNVLARINRELGGRFDLDRFRHVALWNEARSRIEMHLESRGDQVVAIEALGLRVPFRDGERIHTESSVKYDDAMVDGMLGGAGFRRERTWHDEERRFAVHLARVTS
jgi:dimethylhistidine N-methyltransferase